MAYGIGGLLWYWAEHQLRALHRLAGIGLSFQEEVYEGEA